MGSAIAAIFRSHLLSSVFSASRYIRTNCFLNVLMNQIHDSSQNFESIRTRYLECCLVAYNGNSGLSHRDQSTG